MKVLFAVKDDKVSEAIVKKYQEKYQEIISYKNVYYFNAIYKELQKEKGYDRIVINEDLEPFANNNFDNIDKFLFDKLDNISDEATDNQGKDIPIILVCLDRRNKSEDVLIKYFGLGIYNALLGKDRSLDEVCKLIHQPRTKKEAKQYYKIGADNVGYKVENENSVSEAEMQNIIAHYKRLGKNEEKYVDSFNNIITQYNDEQLKIIIHYLPENVKNVLKQESLKYQQLTNYVPKEDSKKTYLPLNKSIKLNVERVETKLQGKKILIPKEMNFGVAEKVNVEMEQDNQQENKVYDMATEQKRGRGRPKKVKTEETIIQEPKRGRGRPKKVKEENQTENEEADDLLALIAEVENKDLDLQKNEEEIDLFSLDESKEKVNVEDEEELDLFGLDESDEEANVEDEEELDLFDFDESKEETNFDDEEEFDLFDTDENKVDTELVQEEKDIVNSDEESNVEEVNLFDFEDQDKEDVEEGKVNRTEEHIEQYENPEDDNKGYNIMQEAQTTGKYNLNRLLTSEKKVASFLGTTKNGTSFIVNHTAKLLSDKGISVAILDMTQNKNSYYIYTENDESLRKIATSSLTKLNSGIADGIKVNKNLTVYCGMPNQEEDLDIYQVLATLLEYHAIVLVDCDFSTNIDVFKETQELYLVQSLDVLTIQPLTSFLRELKMRGALEQNKIRVIINKDENVRGLNAKRLIGGMSTYNEPSMSFMTELFNKDLIPYVKIPFDIKNYVKYLEGIVECRVNLSGYTKKFVLAMHELANMVYPLINNKKYVPNSQNHFTNEVNNTLEKMKNNK